MTVAWQVNVPQDSPAWYAELVNRLRAAQTSSNPTFTEASAKTIMAGVVADCDDCDHDLDNGDAWPNTFKQLRTDDLCAAVGTEAAGDPERYVMVVIPYRKHMLGNTEQAAWQHYPKQVRSPEAKADFVATYFAHCEKFSLCGTVPALQNCSAQIINPVGWPEYTKRCLRDGYKMRAAQIASKQKPTQDAYIAQIAATVQDLNTVIVTPESS